MLCNGTLARLSPIKCRLHLSSPLLVECRCAIIVQAAATLEAKRSEPVCWGKGAVLAAVLQ